MAYTGETRSSKLRARLSERNVGCIVVRGRVGKAAVDQWRFWAYDNGAFTDWRHGTPFDETQFLDDVLTMTGMSSRPNWVVLPDVVAGGRASLATSVAWLSRLHRLPLSFAIAVQDGMVPADIPWGAPFDVVFVGGTTRWKLETGAEWAAAARAHGKVCHIGRVGSARRVLWAAAAGADSVDSALPLFSEGNLQAFLGVLGSPFQSSWEWAAPRIGVSPLANGRNAKRSTARALRGETGER